MATPAVDQATSTAESGVGADRRPIRALLAANGISLLGNNLTALAVPWFVLESTGSAARTGVVAFVQLVPVVLTSFFGGALVDRLSHKRLSIAADLTSGATVAAVPLLHLTIGLAYWQLLALAFLGAVLDTPGGTARAALEPDLAARAAMPLERMNGIQQVLGSGASLIGPPLAGVLIAAIGASSVLFVDAATFVVSAALVAVAVPDLDRVREASDRYWSELLDGWRFLRRDRALFTFMVLAAALNFAAAPLGAVVLPVFARETYDSARAFGLMLGGFGGGALAGGLFLGALGPRLPRRLTIGASLAAFCVVFAVMSALPPLPLSIVLLAIVGVAAGAVNVIVGTVLQERTPAELRGRVFGTTSATSLAAGPAGILVGAATLETHGPQTAFGGIAAVFAVATVAFLLLPAMRDLDRRPGAPMPT